MQDPALPQSAPTAPPLAPVDRCIRCGCDRPLPPGHRRNRRFCSGSCRTLAYLDRAAHGLAQKRGERRPALPAGLDNPRAELPLLTSARKTLTGLSKTVLDLERQFGAEELALRRALEVVRSKLTLEDGLQADLDAARRQLAERDKELAEIRKDSAEVHDLRRELRGTKLDLAGRETAYAMLEESARAEAKKLKLMLAEANRENQALAVRYNEQSVLMNPASRQAQHVLIHARGRAAQMEAEAARAREELNQRQQTYDAQAAAEKQARADAERARADAAAAIAQRDEAAQGEADAQARNRALAEKLEQTQAALNTAVETLGALRRDFGELRDAARQREERIHLEIDALRGAVTAQTDALTSLQTDAATLRATIALRLTEASSSTDHLVQEVQSFGGHLRETEARIAGFLNQATTVQAQFSELKASIESGQQRQAGELSALHGLIEKLLGAPALTIPAEWVELKAQISEGQQAQRAAASALVQVSEALGAAAPALLGEMQAVKALLTDGRRAQDAGFAALQGAAEKSDKILACVSPLKGALADVDARLLGLSQEHQRLRAVDAEGRTQLLSAQQYIAGLLIEYERERADKLLAQQEKASAQRQLAATQEQAARLLADVERERGERERVMKGEAETRKLLAAAMKPAKALEPKKNSTTTTLLRVQEERPDAPVPATALVQKVQQSGSFGVHALVRSAGAALSPADSLPPAANSLDRLADSVVAPLVAGGQRRDYHLLGRTLMHCAMEEALRTAFPLDIDETSRAVVSRFGGITQEYKEVLPAEFLRWLTKSGRLVEQVARASVERLAVQLATAAPSAMILNRSELVELRRARDDLQQRLAATSANADAAQQVAALQKQIDELKSQNARLSSEVAATKKKAEAETDDDDWSDDDVLKQMMQKVDLLHQIGRYQKALGETVTGKILASSSQRAILKAARGAATEARWHYFRSPSSDHIPDWQDCRRGKLLDWTSEFRLAAQIAGEVEELKKEYKRLSDRYRKLFGDLEV